jgi:hypothetical protein
MNSPGGGSGSASQDSRIESSLIEATGTGSGTTSGGGGGGNSDVSVDFTLDAAVPFRLDVRVNGLCAGWHGTAAAVVRLTRPSGAPDEVRVVLAPTLQGNRDERELHLTGTLEPGMYSLWAQARAGGAEFYAQASFTLRLAVGAAVATAAPTWAMVKGSYR